MIFTFCWSVSKWKYHTVMCRFHGRKWRNGDSWNRPPPALAKGAIAIGFNIFATMDIKLDCRISRRGVPDSWLAGFLCNSAYGLFMLGTRKRWTIRKWKYENNICHKRFSSIVNIISSSYFLTDWLLHTLEYRINKSKLSFHCRSRFQKEESISNLRILASTLETLYPEWSHYILSSGPPDHVSFWQID